jgi:hypothetical protein
MTARRGAEGHDEGDEAPRPSMPNHAGTVPTVLRSTNRASAVAVFLCLAFALPACGANHPRAIAPPTSTTTTSSTPTTISPTTTAAPAFASASIPVRATDLSSSWRSGCPIGPDQLRRLQLSYWGFDNAAHTGTLIVNASVAANLTKVFARLYAQRFPIRQMVPVDNYGGSDEASLDADNTAAFNCRYAVAAGPKHWSEHAYGTAIDVDPVENPYVDQGVIHPAGGAAYVKRTPIRPGMAYAGGVLNAAFASVGWKWGGTWSSPDYQHFSETGG